MSKTRRQLRRRARYDRDLLILIGGNEAGEGDDARDLRQGREAGGERARRLDRGRNHFGGVAGGGGVAAQVPKRRDRLAVRVHEVERIVVEPQPIERRQQAEDDERGAEQHGPAPPRQIIVDRRERGVAERLGSPGGSTSMIRAGSTVMLVTIGDQHADARDQTEFGNAALVGRQEGKESCRGRERGERKWRRHPVPGRAQRVGKTAEPVALVAIAHAELDGEIDADADEENGEIDRNDVEGADQRDPRRGGGGKADDQRSRKARRSVSPT